MGRSGNRPRPGKFRLRGDLARAEQVLSDVQSATKEDALDDVRTRLCLLEAQLAVDRGDPSQAQAPLQAASELAAHTGQHDLRAEVELWIARAWAQLGASELSGQHRRRARELWERVAATVPEPMRALFWDHPRRAALKRDAPRSVGRENKLLRLLELNSKLASSLDPTRLVELAMDAAIELTGAERGFLILEEAGQLEVQVARNFDRERLGKSHLKFSRGIAEQVIESAEPLVTVDASSDSRLRENASVHAMKLRSVACVPVRSSEKVLGALYVDNRFAEARFYPADVQLLLAFSDQVAIALRNARLHNELVQRSEQLEAERQRVEELAQGQAVQIDRLSEEVRASRAALELRHDFGRIVARSEAMRRVLNTLDRVIDSPLSVLVVGESGTGKELVARAIHHNGPTRQGPFMSINCAALPDSLLESELFGHKKGAFTGAERDHEGLMVAASGGCLFLDELGEMSLGMQVKLLRALQEREVRPVGGTRSQSVDFRLIAATNRDLRAEIDRGAFREDLYYRVGVVEVVLPPLRQRQEDIPELTQQLLEQIAVELGRPKLTLSRPALRKVLAHDFPGNVRELRNLLTKAAVLSDGDELRAQDLELSDPGQRPERALRSRKEFQAAEAEAMERALTATRWNVSEAARRLGVSRATLYRRLARNRSRDPRDH